jgi:hypothetical protein
LSSLQSRLPEHNRHVHTGCENPVALSDPPASLSGSLYGRVAMDSPCSERLRPFTVTAVQQQQQQLHRSIKAPRRLRGRPAGVARSTRCDCDLTVKDDGSRRWCMPRRCREVGSGAAAAGPGARFRSGLASPRRRRSPSLSGSGDDTPKVRRRCGGTEPFCHAILKKKNFLSRSESVVPAGGSCSMPCSRPFLPPSPHPTTVALRFAWTAAQ